MSSLLDLVNRVNKGDCIDATQLEAFQQSPNSAERFLANHAQALLDLRSAQQHMLQSLEAIDYADQKVIQQFLSVCGFLNQTDLLPAPLARFGASAIARGEIALGLEAIQHAVAADQQNGAAYTRDRANARFITTQYERAAQTINWQPVQQPIWQNPQMRIGLLASGLADDEASARLCRGLTAHCDAQRFRVNVYSTESAVRRDRQRFAQPAYVGSSERRGAKTLSALSKAKSPAFLADIDGDVVSAALLLAAEIIRDRIDVLLIDASIADPIAALVACWNTASVKISLGRRAPLCAAAPDCVVYLDQERFESDQDLWSRTSVPYTYILEGIDLADLADTRPKRSGYGIPEQSVVLATACSDLDQGLAQPFVDTVCTILQQNTSAIFLAIGDGEATAAKRKFDSAGVGKRVGFAGKRRDLPEFLRIADIYLAEFPSANTTGILQAMAVERPVIALKWGEPAAQAQAAAIVGSDAAITSRDTKTYIDWAAKLIRDPATRRQTAQSMRARVEQHFSFTQTARQIEQLCEQIVERKAESRQIKAQPRETQKTKVA